jgi:UDP-glucose 4-epimerase
MSAHRIFVTGGSGFIGRNTIPALLLKSCRVVALEHIHPIFPQEHDGLKIVRGAIDHRNRRLREGIASCDTLLHLAGASTPASTAEDPSLDVRVNLLPILALLHAASGTRIKRIVSISSGGTIYGVPAYTPIDESHPTIPTSPYGVVKLAIEHVIRLWAIQQGVEYIILRVGNPYGPHQRGHGHQGVVGTWLPRVLKNRPLVVWGDGSIVRDYIYVGDVAEALAIGCTQANLPSGPYNIGTGTGVSLLEIARTLAEVTGRRVRLKFEPGRPFDPPVNILSPKHFATATGWRATTPLREGIVKTLSHAADHGIASGQYRAGDKCSAGNAHCT